MSTASWLLSCSHSPSEANIRNWSCGWSSCSVIEGSPLKIGLLIGSRSLYLVYNGSLLNSAFLRYMSPMDLDTYKRKKQTNKQTLASFGFKKPSNKFKTSLR